MTSYTQTIGVELRDIDIKRGGELIASGISLLVSPGDIIQLFGTNGSGKTSLLQTIAGLTPISCGKIFWHIKETRIQTPRPANLISFIGHNAPLKQALTGAENLQYWAKIYGIDRDNVPHLLSHVGLVHVQNLPAGQYSAGQKRRLDLARCLLVKRPLWLLDEPTSSLDDDSRALWVQAIQAHQNKGGCAVIGTHDRLEVNSRDIRLG